MELTFPSAAVGDSQVLGAHEQISELHHFFELMKTLIDSMPLSLEAAVVQIKLTMDFQSALVLMIVVFKRYMKMVL